MSSNTLFNTDFTGVEQQVMAHYGRTHKSSQPNTGRLVGKRSDFAVVDDPAMDFDETGVLIDNNPPIFDYSHGRRPINWNQMSNSKRKLYEKRENQYWKKINDQMRKPRRTVRLAQSASGRLEDRGSQ